MSKYIVKNCPNYHNGYISCTAYGVSYCFCEGCTDCLIKQVIEKCKKKKEWFSKLPDGVAFNLTTLLGGIYKMKSYNYLK